MAGFHCRLPFPPSTRDHLRPLDNPLKLVRCVEGCIGSCAVGPGDLWAEEETHQAETLDEALSFEVL